MSSPKLTLEHIESVEPVLPIEPVESVESVESVEPVLPIESVESVLPIESVESVESVEPVQSFYRYYSSRMNLIATRLPQRCADIEIEPLQYPYPVEFSGNYTVYPCSQCGVHPHISNRDKCTGYRFNGLLCSEECTEKYLDLFMGYPGE